MRIISLVTFFFQEKKVTFRKPQLQRHSLQSAYSFEWSLLYCVLKIVDAEYQSAKQYILAANTVLGTPINCETEPTIKPPKGCIPKNAIA